MLSLRNLTIAFGQRPLLDHACATFSKGCLTALIGRNGAGKSTLLRAVAGLGRHYQGQILLDGQDIKSLPPGKMARLLSMVTTERTRIPSLRCQDVVAIGRAPYTNWIGRMQQVDRDIVLHSLHAVGMQSYALRTMDTMSDGECQRIMIARALAQDTPVILLDEPTSFLDLPGRHELVCLLQNLAHQEGKCILFSTHELDIALQHCDSIALIDGGALHHLPVDEMAQSGHIERLFSN